MYVGGITEETAPPMGLLAMELKLPLPICLYERG